MLLFLPFEMFDTETQEMNLDPVILLDQCYFKYIIHFMRIKLLLERRNSS